MYWHLLARRHANIAVVQSVEDIRRVRADGQVGLLLAALGPMPFGIIRDLAVSYRPTLLGAAAAACLVALGSLAIPDPQRRHLSSPEP